MNNQNQDLELITNLTDTELAQYLDQAEQQLKFYEAVKQEALHRAKNGVVFANFTLKEFATNRQIPEQNLEMLLKLAHTYNIDKSQLYETKLLSVAKLEKALKKQFPDFVQDLNTISEASLTYRLVKNKDNKLNVSFKR